MRTSGESWASWNGSISARFILAGSVVDAEDCRGSIPTFEERSTSLVEAGLAPGLDLSRNRIQHGTMHDGGDTGEQTNARV